MADKLKNMATSAAAGVVYLVDLLVLRPLRWLGDRLGLPILGRHLGDAWRWASRWRRIVVPTVAIVVSVATILAVLVLTDANGDRAIDVVVQGVQDDRCIRPFSAAASAKRSELQDAQAQVTVRSFGSVKRLSQGLVAGLLQDDEAAVLAAVNLLNDEIDQGDLAVGQIAAVAGELAMAEGQLTSISLAARDDRALFRRMCEAGPG